MPSGAAPLQCGDERVHAAAVGGTGAAQGDDLGRIEAVGAAGGGAAGAARGRPGSGAEAAVHTAPAVPHGRLPAAAAGAGVGAAAGGGEEVARRGTVAEPAAPLGRQAGRRNRRKEPMPSGGGAGGEAAGGLGMAAGAEMSSSHEGLRVFGKGRATKKGPAPVRRTTPCHNIVQFMFLGRALSSGIQAGCSLPGNRAPNPDPPPQGPSRQRQPHLIVVARLILDCHPRFRGDDNEERTRARDTCDSPAPQKGGIRFVRAISP
jgi:hypothetical protein